MTQPNTAEPSDNVRALLMEIAGLIDKLVQTGENGAIDLKSLPMLPDDYNMLKYLLGEGEVNAQLQALGRSNIIETVYPGVWWITHFNENGELVADTIEITFCPPILASQKDDISQGLMQLQTLLNP